MIKKNPNVFEELRILSLDNHRTVESTMSISYLQVNTVFRLSFM